MPSSPHIPVFPDSRPLDFSDKPLLDRLFVTIQPRVSELTFACLYLFRHAHNYRLSTSGETLVITGTGYDGGLYALPPVGGNIAAALTDIFDAGLPLYGADELFATTHLSGRHIQLTEDRDAFDYLYLRSDLADLPGSRFHKKKNRINYFAARHRFEIEPFRDDHVAGCRKLLDEWTRVRMSGESRSTQPEAAATDEGITCARQLGLEGVVVTVEGAIAAFALGERLNRTTSVCHFEKSNPFMEGVAQLVDREFNRRLFTDCTYVNREQDLGEPGLRTAKLSYHPVELIRKFRATRRNPS
jgi:hypothetical protein